MNSTLAPEQIVISKAQAVSKKQLSSFIVAVVLFIIFMIVTFALPPHCGRFGYFAGLKDKHRILEKTVSPKIVFVGGSNLAFGLDSSFIERRFHKPVVNMGLCYSFGLRYLLEEVKDNIHAGDIVVLVPEYGLIDGITVNGNPDLIRALEVHPRSLPFVLRAYTTSLATSMTFIHLMRGYLIGKWNAFSKILQIAWQDRQFNSIFLERPEVSAQIGPSARFCFDKHGDYFGHFGHLNNIYTPTKWLIGQMTKEAAGVINKFGKIVQQRGAEVVLIPPPVPTEYFLLSGLTPQKLCGWTNKLLTIPVLATPMRYIIPVSYFYEAPYHLNVEGRAIRTKLIADDLEHYFRSNSKQQLAGTEGHY